MRINPLEVTFSRSYKDEKIHKQIYDTLSSLDSTAVFAKFRGDGEMQAKFFKILLDDGAKSVADAWSEILFDVAEKHVVASIEYERELRKRCNVSAPEDLLPINLDYERVNWK